MLPGNTQHRSERYRNFERRGDLTLMHTRRSALSSVIKTEQDGNVRTIILNRPDKMNAISDELGWAVVSAVEDAAQDDSVWVIAMTGSGNAFCAGLDLTGERDPTQSTLSPQSRQIDDIGWVGRFLLVLREQCEKPVIAGINGAAVGAGLALAMAADIRIVARNARLIAGYPRIGGSPDGGLSYTLVQAIGYEQAMRFMLENKTVTGEDAVALGMAGEMAEDEDIRTRLDEYCQGLAKWSPITGRLTKRVMVKAAATIDLENHVRFERDSIMRAFASEDAKECRRAFIEKRDPVIKGR